MRIASIALLLTVFALSAAADDERLFLVQFTVGEKWVKEKAPNEQAFFAEHSANLKRLRTEGKLLLGGRYSDKGVIIVKAASEEAVQREIQQDPSVSHGTFVAAVFPFAPFYDGCVERKK